jgi:plasmid stability protein
MRTTISLDDDLYSSLRERAARMGCSVSRVIEDAVRVALSTPEPTEEPFVLITYGEGGPVDGVDLDRVGALLAADDEGAYRP